MLSSNNEMTSQMCRVALRDLDGTEISERISELLRQKVNQKVASMQVKLSEFPPRYGQLTYVLEKTLILIKFEYC